MRNSTLLLAALLVAPVSHANMYDSREEVDTIAIDAICAHRPAPSRCEPIARAMVDTIRKQERSIMTSEYLLTHPDVSCTDLDWGACNTDYPVRNGRGGVNDYTPGQH